MARAPERDEARIDPIGVRPLLTRGAVAAGGSVLVNWLLLLAVRATDLVAPFGALSTPPVTLLTLLGASAATAVYGIVTRLSTTPDRTFGIVAGVALLASFVPDAIVLVADPAATASAVAVLATMHVTVAVVSVTVLTDGAWPLGRA